MISIYFVFAPAQRQIATLAIHVYSKLNSYFGESVVLSVAAR